VSSIKDYVLTIDKDELPTGWEMAPIGDLVGTSGVFVDGDWVESKDQDPNGDVRLIQLADIGDGNYRNRSTRFLTSSKAKQLGCTFLEKGDVLVARMPDPLGRACLFPGDAKSSVTVVDVAIIRPSDASIASKWLMYFINSPAFRSAVASMESGSTRKRISRKNLSKIVLPVPPANEQTRIVAEIEKQFSRLDEAVANLKRVKSNLKRYKAAVLKAAVEGKLTEEWRKQHPDVEPADKLLERILAERREKWQGKGKYKEPVGPNTSELPELPAGWVWGSVEQLGASLEQAVLTGPFGSNIGKSDFVESGIPVLTIGCLKESGLSLEKVAFVSEAKALELERYKLRQGDILFSRMASVGRAGLVTKTFDGALFNYHIMRLRLSQQVVLPMYFICYVRGANTVTEYVREVNHGATRDGINTEQLQSLPVALPPFAEQYQIVAEVERRLSLVAEAETQVDANLRRADRLRQSILKKAFSGQLVPQDPNDESVSVLMKRIGEKASARDGKTRGPRRRVGK